MEPSYRIVHQGGKSFVDVTALAAPLTTERDAADLVAVSWECETSLLMLPHEAFADEFFRLRTGLAGAVLQKFGNYGLTVAAVIPGWYERNDRFTELALESNKGRTFGVFDDRSAAEAWLLK
ncbi:DUF4180 domain-containing protein [Deinococcus yavapaiensis]|uniref:Uncharacterized protein DUF4180 n=1 Tax=Deinococcus yavapaiensis KR-236 TaxID=694435 RepID=A0A318SC54_9DEIO|nr:DUF4180 domain-containing protein [Deinococcus yavapaiensis]PYE55964.1 uncharacterized protein DUF4180 [Deinococcus yavapaiensis KR-236]